MKLLSTPTQQYMFSQQNLANLVAVAAGIAVSVGLWNTLPSSQTRFHFQQQIGTDVLSGSFEGVDSNSDGVVELSEVKTFQATWGKHSWDKEDLEAFVWGQKITQSYQDKQHQFNGLNLFARTHQDSQSQILQIQNRGVFTPQKQTHNIGIFGVEYGKNKPDKTLFYNQNFKLEITHNQASSNLNSMKVSICLGLLGLLFWKPLVPDFAVTEKYLRA